ncbi:hypothetical protein M998_3434 [Providencia heimbachae ATCC 35613]|uniref:Uncharacterized protein n=2 Tax=Providencia heimbachae TaxID=333962 RepID=A0A1B7JJC0_9GAMM|nr:hypothetical protein M998_3434 [Providencia heimbachae ATCC 35613]
MWAGAIIEQAYQSQEHNIKILSKGLKNASVSTMNKAACL